MIPSGLPIFLFVARRGARKHRIVALGGIGRPISARETAA
jgi:hypothetical protein